ncbi:4953_t:CDS:2 [Cetraspora pellucida]|uniref:4953_t:CDS:1 n=1 Tax=Cetraspora pellucida TaxID=1433469 RepID=A0ACA9KV06_9GLOM|nr:4953_t:CDS:2 [Cetraspora pellucida]
MESSNTSTFCEYNFMSREIFNNILTEFIQSKAPKYQESTVISRERAEKCIEILENLNNNELKNSNAMNTEYSHATKHTPYEIVFGQKPRCNLPIVETLYHQNFICEEDIPENVALEIEPNLENSVTINNTDTDNDNESVTSNSELPEIIVLQQIDNQETVDLTNSNNNNMSKVDENENTIEKTGEDKENYETIPTFQKIRNTVRKNLEHNREIIRGVMESKSNSKRKVTFEIGDYVKDGYYKLGCTNGIIDTCFRAGDIGLLESSDYPELTEIPSTKLSLRTAAIKQSGISVSKAVCHCKGNCLSKRYACSKNNLKCSSKCHSGNNIVCQNK